MHSLVLQDGTNSFLKFDRKPADVFESFKNLSTYALKSSTRTILLYAKLLQRQTSIKMLLKTVALMSSMQ